MIELFFEILFEFVAELVLEILVELGLGALLSPSSGKERHAALAYLGIVLMGAIAGFLFSLAVPKPVLSQTPVPGLSLVLSPLLAGTSMMALGRWRRSKGRNATRLATFFGGALFAFALAFVRWQMT